MKLNELRHGNYVFDNYRRKVLVIECLEVYFDEIIEPSNIKGIKLTPAWMERFSFKLKNKGAEWHKGAVVITVVKNQFSFRIGKINRLIKSVHNLQNLILILTGHDLRNMKYEEEIKKIYYPQG